MRSSTHPAPLSVADRAAAVGRGGPSIGPSCWVESGDAVFVSGRSRGSRSFARRPPHVSRAATTLLVALACNSASGCVPTTPEGGGVQDSGGAATAAPHVTAGPFGHPDSVLLWTPEQQRAGFPHYHLIFPTRSVAAGGPVYPLHDDARGGSGAEMARVNHELGLEVDAFMASNPVAGLIVVQGGSIAAERYGAGHDRDTRWVSYSVAKSVVSMLIGAAIHDGYIGSVDDPVTAYVPILREGAYATATVRDVLTMTSGVAWNEDYSDPGSDVSREIDFGGLERLRFLGDRGRVASPGARFNYSTGEIFLAGAIVRGAVGNNLSAYLEQKIWRPFGMEADANWMLVEPGGVEYAGCCISATLRDYARIGLFALVGGELPDGTKVLPEEWMRVATTPTSANPGYGYLWWLHEDGSFSARGIFGQLIHVDPARDLVVAMHGLWPTPTSPELTSARDAFLEKVKGRYPADQPFLSGPPSP